MSRRYWPFRRRWRRWVELTVVGAGAVGFLAAGGWQAYDVYRLSTRGVVVHATMIEEHDSGRDHWIEMEYTNRTGALVHGETSNFRDADRTNLFDVVYDPDDPTRVQAADWGFDYWLPGVCLVIGSALAGLTLHARRHGFPDWIANW